MRIPSTPSDLYRLIVQSQLLEQHRVSAYQEGLKSAGAEPRDAIECAQLMVFDGLLTQFQARLLLQGKWKNFYLDGKYRILDHLGSGGMGQVFLCEHRYMRRLVAIKTLVPDQTHSTAVVQRFLREAQAVARLDHPNIVRAHDIGQHRDTCFLVLEFVPGVNLQTLVENRGPLSVACAVNYVIQAAMGLNHAHMAGLVHRDVKPANLLVDHSGTVKLLDLGLARFAFDDPEEKDGAVLGTADYIAPEQALDATTADCRSDVYSLGCTLHFLLVGKPPFDGGSVPQKLIWHQSAQPRPASAIRPAVPRGISDVILQMMEKDPFRRPQSAAEVVELLRQWYVPVPPPDRDEMPTVQLGRAEELVDIIRPETDSGGSSTLSGIAGDAKKTVPLQSVREILKMSGRLARK